MAETPFFLWSIAEAGGWLINVPVFGFVLLVALPFVVVVVALYVFGIWADILDMLG